MDEADALERIRAAKRARVEVEEQHKRHRGQVLLSDEED